MGNSGLLVRPRTSQPLVGGNTGRLISAHYLEIEYLLERVERAVTHYQMLGIERAATGEEIISAYHRTVAVLHPSYYKIRLAMPDEMLIRIDRAFGRVSEAFSTLTNFRSRVEYDREQYGASQPRPAVDNVRPMPPVKSSHLAKPQAPLIHRPRQPEAFVTNDRAAEETDRRRCDRIKMTIPVLVSGYDATNGKWQEMTKTFDVSRMGVGIRMRSTVRHGIVLHLSLPLPTKLRSHGYPDPAYNVYAIVRRIELPENEMRVIGLEFVGEQPPRGYLHKPWGVFRTEKWSGPDRRREPRHPLKEMVMIEYLNEMRGTLAKEVALTENVSRSGARICVKAAPDEFCYVRVSNMKRTFVSIAVVRNRYNGLDGAERLCLQFIDQKWPV